MKANLCDVCLAEGKMGVPIWKYRNGGASIVVCYNHKSKKLSKLDPSVLFNMSLKAQVGYSNLAKIEKKKVA